MKSPRRYFIVNLRIDELQLINAALSYCITSSDYDEERERLTKLAEKIQTIRERLEIRQAYEIRKGDI